MARIATLSRFPAGQLDWEVSGIPRSWLLKVPRRSLPRLVSSILFELRGFQPAFFSHINPNRRNQGILLERESLRSYHRMARSMERQPEIKGLITASWLHSPDTFAVSPHLAWLNKVFEENGGHVLPLGPADIDSGSCIAVRNGSRPTTPERSSRPKRSSSGRAPRCWHGRRACRRWLHDKAGSGDAG